MNRDPAPHEVLGVRPDASVPEITSAYRRLARELHPDVASQVETAAQFSAVTEAYQALLAASSAEPRPERGVPVRVRRASRRPAPGSPLVAGPVWVTPPSGGEAEHA